VLATARRLGVTLIAYSPLRAEILTGRFHDVVGKSRFPHQVWACPTARPGCSRAGGQSLPDQGLRVSVVPSPCWSLPGG
jgi:aryl-alcohol dehydrogenase-like predicted oxidoreductase